MNDYLKEREIQRKREYHRKWRAEHRESVIAAQERYWLKKAAERRSQEQASHFPEQQETGCI